jgi:ribosome-binding factor A
METIRQKQIAELVLRNFSMVLVAEGRFIVAPSVLVTVTNVVMSPDLGLAKIYLSIFNALQKEEVLAQLEENHNRLKLALHQRLKKQMRVMPEFKLYLDDTVDEMYNVDALFSKISNVQKPYQPEQE